MKQKTILLLMGKSGCGKSTLERALVERWPSGFNKVVSSTTRPKREGEVDQKDYYFVTEEEYDKIDFIQTTSFAGYRYGSAVSEYTSRHPILCVVPSSAKDFTEVVAKRFPDWNTYNVYFNISNERLFDNMKSRGDTTDMIHKRIAADTLDAQFIDSGLIADFVVTDDILDEKLPGRVYTQLQITEETREIRRLATISHRR